VLDSPRIVEMDMTSAKFLQRFNGSINTGIIYSKGNESTQFTLGSQVTIRFARGLGVSFEEGGVRPYHGS